MSERILRGINPSLSLLIIFILTSLFSINVYAEVVIQNVVIEVNVDGTTLISYALYITDPPSEAYLKLPDEPLFFRVYVNGSRVPAYYESGNLYFYAESSNVLVSILSNGLTRKEGFKWIFQANLTYPYKLILPKNTIILDISTEDFSVSVEDDGRLGLLLPSGDVTITYTFPPESLEVDEAEGDGLPIFNIIPVLIVGGILTIALLHLLKRRRDVEVEFVESGLDDRDRLIIESLKGGMKTAQQIMEETGIPKSPLYRRLSKLENEGIIGSMKKGNVKYYFLKEDKG